MSRGSTTDEQLMAQVAAGDRGALERLVRRYANPLLTYLERMMNDHHQAEELFQEVFLRVWLKRTQYRTGKPFRSWVFAIATNCGRSQFRKAKISRSPFVDADEMSDGTDSPVTAAVSTETAAIVSNAVAQLPQTQRTVVVLRIWNGLSFDEIAKSVGCGESTARSHMHHGLNSMRRFLEARL